MTNLLQLFSQYGYQIALLGLLGTIIIEILKKPINKLLKAKFPAILEDAQKFDIVAFIISFIMAILLAVSYSLIISEIKILYIIQPDGTREVATLSIYSYLTNILGTWMFQTVYYSIYKKLGLKKLIQIILQSIVSAVAKGELDLGNIATDALDNITTEAGEAAEINQEEQIEKLKDISKQAITKGEAIIEDTKKAIKEMKEEVANKIEQTATRLVTDKNEKPVIKF